MIATTDYERLREAVGLVDRSARGKLRLTGAEAADYLQGQVTNDVVALAPGTGLYAALLNHKGKMLTDMRVLRARRTASGSTRSRTASPRSSATPACSRSAATCATRT